MRTQCSHCQSMFKVPEEHKGNKVKCPKCGQLFVIRPFVEKAPLEVCSSCGRNIGKLDHPCVFEGEVVCTECDEKFREVRRVSPDAELPPSKSPEQVCKPEWLPLSQASKAGIIVASIVILSGIGMLFYKSEVPHAPAQKMREISIPAGAPILDNQGNIVGFGKERKVMIPEGPFDPPPDPETVRFRRLVGIGAILGIGICILLRSFLSGLGAVRLLLTILGGLIVGFSFGQIFAAVVCWGWSINPGALAGSLICSLPGAVLLKYGFRPKKSLQKVHIVTLQK
ncbi:MAG: zinc-ribbon domain-containing protein [Sedimentisphaerales bacterium]|nr:zinc-ribbon domain-containing protein [Sedimentisphaerales bacterium]